MSLSLRDRHTQSRGRMGVRRAMPVLWLALSLRLVAACAAGPSTSSLRPEPNVSIAPTPEPSAPAQTSASFQSAIVDCTTKRTAIEQPDPSLRETLEQLPGTYPIAGVWGSPPTQLDHTPSAAPFSGELVVAVREAPIQRLESCDFGIEVPLRIALRTDDGAFSETMDATARLQRSGADHARVDGTPGPFVAEVRAQFDLRALSGSFMFADDPMWTFGTAMLSAEVTPFGTRGWISASVEARQPVAADSGARVMAAPAPEGALLRWPSGDAPACRDHPNGDEAAYRNATLYPASTGALDALVTGIEAVATQHYPAKYADGTDTRVTVEIEAPTVFCATNFWASYWHFPSRAHLRTEDGRLDVAVAGALDPGYALVHFGKTTDLGPWAFPPDRLSEQIGHVDAELNGYSYVGLEVWFGLSPEARGWIKVLGFRDGGCLDCTADKGCSECAWTARHELLTLFIGAEAEPLPSH